MEDDRYARHSLIDWFPQDIIRRSRFAVVGAGAVGNEVIKNLALLGSGQIDIFDFDTIEIHNLTRSALFSEGDIGLAKATRAAQWIEEHEPNVIAKAFVGDFWNLLSLSQLKQYDCVFCCVDNYESAIRLNRLCSILSVDFVNAGIDSKYASAEYYPFSFDPSCACYECNMPEAVYENIRQRYSCSGLKRLAFEAEKVPTTILTSSLAAVLAISPYLHNRADRSDGKVKSIKFNTKTCRSSCPSLATNPNCKNCADRSLPVVLLPAKRLIGNSFMPMTDAALNLTVHCSEPILTEYRCKNCDDNYIKLFAVASSLEESFSVCPTCKDNTRDVSRVTEQFILSELLDNFSGLEMPCKYMTFEYWGNRFLIEFEEVSERKQKK